jgi:hypothetical protein
MKVRHARGETGPPAQSRARATYSSVVSVTLLLSASESAAAPAPPIWLFPRLQRGVRVRHALARQGRGRKAGRAQLTTASSASRCIHSHDHRNCNSGHPAKAWKRMYRVSIARISGHTICTSLIFHKSRTAQQSSRSDLMSFVSALSYWLLRMRVSRASR